MENPEIFQLLSEIRNELELLTIDVKLKALSRFEEEFLTTSRRREMWRLFDGKHSSEDIAGVVKVSARSVQMFIQELEERDLIDVILDGRTKYPRKNIAKVAAYYARMDFESSRKPIAEGGAGQVGGGN